MNRGSNELEHNPSSGVGKTSNDTRDAVTKHYAPNADFELMFDQALRKEKTRTMQEQIMHVERVMNGGSSFNIVESTQIQKKRNSGNAMLLGVGSWTMQETIPQQSRNSKL